MSLSRQQKILLCYISDGYPHTTYEIGKKFLEDYKGIWYDLRKRSSELARKGLLTSDHKTPASYTITQDGIIELESVEAPMKKETPLIQCSMF